MSSTTPLAPSLSAAILRTSQMSYRYPASSAAPVFAPLTLQLGAGVHWVGGDEGTGKTTLLQLLAGDLPCPPTANVWVQGQSWHDDAAAYCQQVAWLDPRSTALDAHTPRQIFARQQQSPTGLDAEALAAHIDALSLTPHLDKTLTMLSTGSRRKVLIACALATPTPVILLDQPFQSLDRPSIDYLLALMAHAAAAGKRVWVVADYEAPPGIALASRVTLGKPAP